MRRCVGIWGLLVFAGSQVWATSVPITNPSFEADNPSGAAGPGAFSSPITGWIGSGPVAWYQANTFFGIPNGFNVAAVGNSSNSSLTQTLTTTVQPNTTYKLTFFVGQRNDVPLASWLVDLEANSVILASDSTATPAPGTFVQDSITFNSGPSPAQAGQLLTIKLTDTNQTGVQVDFDAFALDATPTTIGPEPAGVVLLAGGLAALVVLRRRLLS